MVVLTKNIPCTVAEAYEGGEKPNATVDQIEWETSRRGDNDGVGRIPALFVTFEAAIYKWERLNRLIRRRVGLAATVEGGTQHEGESLFF